VGASLGITVTGSGRGPARFASMATLARDAEAAGFEGLWTNELYTHSATIPAGHVAAATERATVGFSIAYGVGRTPLTWTTEARDLDDLSGGRLELGLGNGTARMIADWHGLDGSAPALRMEELVTVLRALWRLCDGPVEHEGRFYRVSIRPTTAVAPPLTSHLPIFTAGVNVRMIEAAGSVADGLWAHPMFTPLYHEQVVRPALASGAERSGRDAAATRVNAPLICVLDEDVDSATRRLKFGIAQYAASKVYDKLFELHGWETVQAAIKAAVRGGEADAAVAAVPDEVAAEIGIACAPDDLLDRLAYHAAPLDHVCLTPAPWGGSPDQQADEAARLIAAVTAQSAAKPTAPASRSAATSASE
jgi:alkanesulfonate monooxygenase SsuD/methylene tetrahydromethanopterin reductase-like flavin-dependent oxidoreductase (luciferase family)